MLRSLDDSDRQRIAPRLVTAPDVPAPRVSRTYNGTRTSPGGNGVTPLEGFGTTVGQAAQSAATGTAAASARGPRTALMAAGAAVLLGAGAFVAYRLTRPAPSGLAASGDTVAASVSATASAAPVPVAPATMPTVQLFILPAEATVEVDEKPAVSKGGVVELTGTLGSAHKVRVVLGTDESTTEVFVTQKGANPAKIVLTPAAPGTARPTAAPKPLGPKPAPPAGLGLRGNR
jgi:serine/threonine-protein kinase